MLTPRDGAPVAIAVLWERWGSGETLLLSFAMVTVEANPLVATIADRMPALLDEGDWAKWLGEEPATAEELKAMLRPAPREFDMRRAGRPPSRPVATTPRPSCSDSRVSEIARLTRPATAL